MCVYAYVFMCAHILIHMCKYVYVYILGCIYIYIYIYNFFAGDLIESKFDILPKFFLNPDSGFAVGDFGYHYSKAAQLGKTTQNVDECEARFKCPLSRNEFARMILT
jgi:hypothetical protein